MNRKVKRYDPISSDGTCGMCIEDADYGAYVEYADYAALEAELAAFKSAVDHVTADGKTTRSFSASEGWAMVHTDHLTDLHIAEEQLARLQAELAKLRAELERRAVDGWKLVPVEPTPDMAAQTAYNGTHYSDPFDFEDFKKDYAAMLAAAPSAPKADDPVKQMLLEALNGMLLHIREPESESEFQWSGHFKKQKAAFVAARAAIAAARQGE